jgi:ATP-dependent RNA helicase DeaD
MSAETVFQFPQFSLSDPILKAIQDVGYESPSPIQSASIPPLLEGRDLLGQAQTGTGKTAAFALPLLSQLDLSLKSPQILVLTPTRELALQVCESMKTYSKYLQDFHIIPLYGGQGMDTQLRSLRRGVQAVVGTPGRIMDHLRRGTLKLDQIKTVVLDEADEMLRMGFLDAVEEIFSQTPDQKQVALFSATMPENVKRIAQRYLNNPVEIKIKSKTATVSTVTQRFWQVTEQHKLDALTRILEVEDFDAMLIFVRTKVSTDQLAEKLEARGYASAVLNGDMSQVLREKTVDRLKKGALDIVVATDVAARGLDVERISHVVNFDMPYDTETYIHRIGRTGRAGRKGAAILFVSPRETRMLRAIEKATRQPIESLKIPSVEDISDRRIAQFKELLTETMESQDLSFFETLINHYQRDHEQSLSDIAAALAFLVQRDRPLPAAELKFSDIPIGSGAQQKPTREKRKRGAMADVDMQSFRVEVGRMHGVQPKHIVGAIANEAGLESSYIGHIKLFDSFSTIDLPQGMPKELFNYLRQVKVCGRPLKISVFTDRTTSQKQRLETEAQHSEKRHSRTRQKAKENVVAARS